LLILNSIVKIEQQGTLWKMGQERFRSAGGFSVWVIALRSGHYFFVTHFNPKEQAMISSYIILTSTAHHGDGRKHSINENFG
jgi:hypothetical protein